MRICRSVDELIHRMTLERFLQFFAIILTSVIAGVMNAIAGGGRCSPSPRSSASAISPIVANATSTVALWPGAVSSMWGYRDELSGSRRWAIGFAVPSLLGGGIGAWLLLRTPPSRFAALVPWLVSAPQRCSCCSRVIVRAIRRGRSSELDDVDAHLAVTTDHTATGSFRQRA